MKSKKKLIYKLQQNIQQNPFKHPKLISMRNTGIQPCDFNKLKSIRAYSLNAHQFNKQKQIIGHSNQPLASSLNIKHQQIYLPNQNYSKIISNTSIPLHRFKYSEQINLSNQKIHIKQNQTINKNLSLQIQSIKTQNGKNHKQNSQFFQYQNKNQLKDLQLNQIKSHQLNQIKGNQLNQLNGHQFNHLNGRQLNQLKGLQLTQLKNHIQKKNINQKDKYKKYTYCQSYHKDQFISKNDQLESITFNQSYKPFGNYKNLSLKQIGANANQNLSDQNQYISSELCQNYKAKIQLGNIKRHNKYQLNNLPLDNKKFKQQKHIEKLIRSHSQVIKIDKWKQKYSNKTSQNNKNKKLKQVIFRKKQYVKNQFIKQQNKFNTINSKKLPCIDQLKQKGFLNDKAYKSLISKQSVQNIQRQQNCRKDKDRGEINDQRIKELKNEEQKKNIRYLNQFYKHKNNLETCKNQQLDQNLFQLFNSQHLPLKYTVNPLNFNLQKLTQQKFKAHYQFNQNHSKNIQQKIFNYQQDRKQYEHINRQKTQNLQKYVQLNKAAQLVQFSEKQKILLQKLNVNSNLKKKLCIFKAESKKVDKIIKEDYKNREDSQDRQKIKSPVQIIKPQKTKYKKQNNIFQKIFYESGSMKEWQIHHIYRDYQDYQFRNFVNTNVINN